MGVGGHSRTDFLAYRPAVRSAPTAPGDRSNGATVRLRRDLSTATYYVQGLPLLVYSVRLLES